MLTEGKVLLLTGSFLKLILLLNSRVESKRLYNTNLYKNIDDELMEDDIVNYYIIMHDFVTIGLNSKQKGNKGIGDIHDDI